MKGQRLRRTLQSALALLLCAALMFSVAGCSQEKPGNSNAGDSQTGESSISGLEETGSSGKGYYVETKLTMPEMEGYVWNLDLVDSVMYIQGGGGCQKSEDDGKTWTEYKLESPLADQIEAEGFSRREIIFSADGRKIIPLSKTVDYDGGFYSIQRNVVVEKDGTERELVVKLPVGEFTAMPGELDSAPAVPKDAGDYATLLNDLTFLPDGSLVGKGLSETVYHVDMETGEVLHTIETSENFQYTDWITGIATTPTTLLLISSARGRMIDLETWEERTDGQTLDEFLLGNGEIQEDGLVTYPGGNEPRRFLELFSDGKEEAFYLLDSNGIYRYIPGGASIEEIVDGALTTFSLQDITCQDFIKTENNGFRVLAATMVPGDHTSVPEYSILGYDFDPNAERKETEELKIYVLQPANDYLNQAAAVFRKNQGNVVVTIETGIDPDAGPVNFSDALRQLNTNIMAGNGPDVILLDMMPIDTYRNKGLLVDLSDVVEQVAAENELLRNITDAYEKDGTICAVPTSFTMPIVVGPEESLNKITGMESLVQIVEDLRKAEPDIKSITGYRMTGEVMGSTQGMAIPTWIQEDGTVDWTLVEKYYDQVKLICDADSNTQTEGIRGSGTEDDPFKIEGYIYDDLAIGQAVLEKESALELRQMRTVLGLPSMCNAIDKGLTYKVLEDDGTCGFTPSYILGISAKSEKIDLAKEFVKMLLGEEMQSFGLKSSSWNGSSLDLPVNFGVVREYFAGKEGEAFQYDTFVGDDFQKVSLDRRNPTLEELESFLAMTQKLNAVLPTQDVMINNALLPQCALYVIGEQTKEESLKKAKEEIELYLAES